MPNFANVPIVFTKGLNTKSDPKTVLSGEFLELDNAVFTRIGTLTTRYGNEVLSREIDGSASSLSEGQALGVYGSELLQFSAGRIYSYAPSTGRWLDRGIARSCVVGTTDVIRNTYQQSNPDVAENAGIRVMVWEDSRGGVRCSVLDAESGGVFQSDVSLHATATKPRVIAFGTELIVWYVLNGNLYYRRISTLSPSSLGAEVNVSSTLDATNNHFDLCVVGDRLFVAVNGNTGAAALVAFDKPFTLWGAAASSYDADNCIALVPDHTRQEVWLIMGEAGGTRVITERYTYTLTVSRGSSSLEGVAPLRVTGAVTEATGDLTAFYEMTAATPDIHTIRKNTRLETGAIGTASVLARGVGLVGKAFEQDGITYVPAAHESALQNTYFLLDSAGTVAARIEPTLGGGLRSTSTLSETQALDGTRLLAIQRKGELVVESGKAFTLLGLASTTLDFGTRSRFRRVEAAGALHFVGGGVQMYDGRAVVEHGFHLFPEGITHVATAASGSLSAGDYQYRVVYEWTDRTGRVHRSAPSVALELTAVANDRIDLTIPTLRLTAKADVRVVIYRTLVNGTTFYRLNPVGTPLMNVTTADTVTYQDGAADTAIQTNEFLYTTADVVENISPGACSIITTYRGRVWLAGLSAPNRVQFSKILRDAEPAAFSDALYLDVDPTGGPITALAAMDDKLVVFKQRAIFIIAGNGPSDTGDGSDYGEPTLLTSDVGSDGPIVCVTPFGLMFRSTKGVYLLDRSNAVKYIGDRVEGFNDLTISGGAVAPDTNQARFVTSDGRALVYDYEFDQWSTFTNYEAVDCDAWGGSFVHLKDDGRVFREDTSRYTDGVDAVEMRAVSGWLQVSDLQGYQRVQRMLVLGDYKSSHQLQIRVGYDFSPNWMQEKQIDAGTLLGSATYGSGTPYGSGSPYGGRFGRYQFSLHLAKQKCQAMRFSLRCLQTSNTPGEALTLTGVTLRVAQKQGVAKLGATKRF